MINFTNFTKLSLKKGQQELYQSFKRSFFSAAQTRTVKKETHIDLRAEFQELLRETTISREEIHKVKLQEENKKKETFAQAEKDWNEKNESLKKEWEQKRSNEDEDNHVSEAKKNLSAKSSGDNGNGNKNDNEDKEKINKSDKDNKDDKNSNKKFNMNEKNNKDENKDAVNPFSKFINGFVKVRKQTFPGEQNVDLIFESRKKEAQLLKSKIKEPTEEEIAEIEALIPEWKRGAVVLIADQPHAEKLSIFEQARRNLTIHAKNLKIYQESIKNYQNSEVRLLVNDLKESYTNVKENIKDSQNPFFVVSRDLIDRVPFKSPSALAITIMRKNDPNFDLILFEKEVDGIFKQLMTAFVKDDLDTVKLLAGETALAVLTSELRSRRERVSI